MPYRKLQITFDCADAGALAEFWAAALGWQTQPPPPGFDSWEAWCNEQNIPYDPAHMAAVVDPEEKGPRLLFIRVPESKTAKNRVHLDVAVSPGPEASAEERLPSIEAKVAELEGLGATKLETVEEHGGVWVVMTDPEGNEFCVT